MIKKKIAQFDEVARNPRPHTVPLCFSPLHLLLFLLTSIAKGFRSPSLNRIQASRIEPVQSRF